MTSVMLMQGHGLKSCSCLKFSGFSFLTTQVTLIFFVPEENAYRMNDWIRNRIIFMLFYSISKIDTKFLRIET